MNQKLHPSFNSSFDDIENHFKKAIECGYKIITCREYVDLKKQKAHTKILVNRVDIDTHFKKTWTLVKIFNKLNIKATFFIRLHGDEYNPFSFENYRCLKFIKDSGHEIGYHSEIIDQSVIWKEDAAACLKRDLAVLNSMLNIQVKGVASHGGLTGLNNLDFWKDHKPSEFGLLYEGYDNLPEFNLFFESLYVSDSNYNWKCYENGKLVQGVHKNLGEHAMDGHPVIYSTIHPDAYYKEYVYDYL